ncbi:MFS sugar transporter [Psilocybe cubensis]|uniref:Major facilitator superfamily (MFS) profile domain-containing protein n=2 Tax=Psilocybe cubensis TaxID=181762 RepID=A0A8H7XM01_PSICU|nr:MFS sugar transporter [Psilocybe cubensis]KAH9476548.1 MFS sugar transporter [Psilocybe cubensis]
MTTLDDTTSKTRGNASDDIHDEKSPIDMAEKDSHTTYSSTENLYQDDALEPVYYAKTLILNRAIEEIGMGKYQYMLFLVSGFGWFADSVWPLITGLILTPVVDEFGFNPPFLSLAVNAGLLVGAVFWGLGCDVWGRRWCFNITLLLAGVFGLAAGGASNFITLASLLAVMGVGVGGNLPIDSAVFLDFVPASRQFLLTFMSIFWCLGQLVVNLLAWPLIANFSCPVATPTSPPCTRSANMGWRYLLFTLGGLTLLLWAIRFFVFELAESPRYLIGKGRDAEAVMIIHKIAAYNGTTSTLTVDQLAAVGGGEFSDKQQETKAEGKKLSLTRTSDFTLGHIKSLFRTRKIAYSTSLLISVWGIIGLASTLYNNFLSFLLNSKGAHFDDATLNITYRNSFILSVVGIPAAFFATWLVEIPQLGRRGALAVSAALTGAFLFATTTARTSNALLGWNCGYSFFSNVMYGILYAISPEIFPGKDRGTGNGLTAAATRVFGLIAPIIALYADITTSVPVYIAGALIIFSGSLALLIPYEPRGKAAM